VSVCNEKNLKTKGTMKKIISLLLVITFVCLAFTSQKGKIYIATGNVQFTSDAPLELIKASSDKLLGILNTENNEFSFRINMRSFKGFNSSLQKEHFNENYVESTKFPKAIFKGRIIENINFLEPGNYNIRAKGKLKIHGIEQNRIIKCSLTILKNKIIVKSNFSVFLKDHDIKIPKIVNQKISEKIFVKVNGTIIPSI